MIIPIGENSTKWPIPGTSVRTRKAQVLPLHLALPACEVRPVGILLLDIGSDRLFCKIDGSTCDEDTAEVLRYLAANLTAKAAELGGASFLNYLEDTLSNVLRVGDREQIYVADPNHALDRIFSERVSNTVKPATASNTGSLSFEPSVLIVEDNPGDVVLIKRALRDFCPTTAVTVAADGEEAIRVIGLVGHNIQKPDLVLLDLNLPKRSGHEVLNSLRANPQLKFTPVAVLTSSKAPTDIQEAYRHGANYYLNKASDLDTFNQTISGLCAQVFQAAP